MKMKVIKKLTDQKKGKHVNRKYATRGFKRNLTSSFAVAGDGVLLFVLFLRLFFENKRRTKMKLKLSVKLREQNNCRNAHS